MSSATVLFSVRVMSPSWHAISISADSSVTGKRSASRTTIHIVGSIPGTAWNGMSKMISGQGLYKSDQGSLNLKCVSA